MKYIIDENDIDNLYDVLKIGFVTKKNIDDMIEYASENHEIKGILMRYKDENIDYQGISKKY